MAVSSIIERHVIFGSSFVLKEDDFFSLKITVAEHFKFDPPEVVMVGSGKLGFVSRPQSSIVSLEIVRILILRSCLQNCLIKFGLKCSIISS